MTALVSSMPRVFTSGEIGDYPVAAGAIVFRGAAVGISAAGDGVAPLIGNSGFVGFASETVNNSSGAAGALRMRVRQKGTAELAVAGVTNLMDVGSRVFATDDNTFTTSSQESSSRIGRVINVVAPGIAIVDFDFSLQFT